MEGRCRESRRDDLAEQFLPEREVIERLVDAHPFLRPVLSRSVADHGELLPYMFIDDVGRLVLDRLGLGGVVPPEVVSILDFFEAELERGDQRIVDFVGAGFLESILDGPTLVRIGPCLAPRLRALATSLWPGVL